MPACITHYLFSKRLLDRFPVGEEGDLSAYFWGAQGPDIFFCHRYLPFMRGHSLSEYGGMIHRARPSETLGLFRDFLSDHPEPVYRAYVRGFLCHYALDATAHPYINARARQWAAERPPHTPGTMHAEIEAALDAIVLRHETGKLPSELPLGRLFTLREDLQPRIAQLYLPVLKGLFGLQAEERELIQMQKDTHLVFSLITDRTGLKLKLTQLFEKGKAPNISSHVVPLTERADTDYANVSHEPWQPENGAPSEADIFELLDVAEEKAGRYIEAFETADLSALTKDEPFG